ncbi:MAG: hypothetical protein ACRD5B_09745 [Nitrososphaeraceae archaeon]
MRTYQFLTVIDCILAKKDNFGLNDNATLSLTHSLINNKDKLVGSTLVCMRRGAISYWLYPLTASSWTLLRHHSIWLLSLFAEDTPQPYQKMFVIVKQYRHKNWVYSYIPNRIRAG